MSKYGGITKLSGSQKCPVSLQCCFTGEGLLPRLRQYTIPVFTTIAVLVKCFEHCPYCGSQNFRGSLGVVSGEWIVGEIWEVRFLKPQERKMLLADLLNCFLHILKATF